MNRILRKVEEEEEEIKHTKDGDFYSHNGLVKISLEMMMVTTRTRSIIWMWRIIPRKQHVAELCALHFAQSHCTHHGIMERTGPILHRASRRKSTIGQAMYVYRNTEMRSRNHCCRVKAKYKYSECVYVTLIIHQSKCMRHIILSSVACQALQ